MVAEDRAPEPADEWLASVTMPEAAIPDEHMSGFESFMWDLERDPQLSSAFANLTLFDRAPDRRAFRSRMERAVGAVPRLGQRVVTSALPWELPRWVEDPDVDLDHHLRWVDLGGDGTRRDLYDLVATLSRQPLDRERPLWEFITIEGLQDGRAAMLQRLHHTITDGEGGIILSVEFLDFEREPAHPGRRRSRRSAEGQVADSSSTDTGTGALAADAPTVSGAWWSRAVGSLGSAATSAASVASSAASATASLPGRAGDLAGVAQSTMRQVRVGHRRSPLWTDRSLGRWFGTTTLSLEDVVASARVLGGSVNDLFLAGAADAAGAVHRQHELDVPELRVSMPISTRHDRSAGGNAFSPTQMLVPTGPMDPADRVAAVHEIVASVRSERAIDALEGTASAAAMLPPAVIVRTGQHLAHSVDFVCSNVRAAPFDLFIAGAFMQSNYPLGPLAGTAFNVTTMSYRGWLFLGLTVDIAAVPDPVGLLEQLDRSYDALLAAAGLPRRAPEVW